jgi:hypothetical protein
MVVDRSQLLLCNVCFHGSEDSVEDEIRAMYLTVRSGYCALESVTKYG